MQQQLLYAFGQCNYGELGVEQKYINNNSNNLVQYPLSIENNFLNKKNIKFIVKGGYHTLIVIEEKDFDLIYGSGANSLGQLGLESFESYNFTEITWFTKLKKRVKFISCGNSHTFIVTEDFKCFGFGKYFQNRNFLEIEELNDDIVKNIQKVVCGFNHTAIILQNGDFYVHGENKYQQLEENENLQMIDRFKKNTNLPIKEPSNNKNEILIKIKAVGLNPLDYGLTTFFSPIGSLLRNRKWIGGSDFSGIVIKSFHPQFKEGDEIMGIKDGPPNGVFQQFLVTNPDGYAITKKPKSLTYEQAAGLSVVMLTNWAVFSLIENVNHCQLFINGASGGTGSIGVLMAKYYYQARKVFGTCSTKNVDYVSSLGCDTVIDYTKQDWKLELSKQQNCKDFVILDYVGNYEMLKFAIKNQMKSYITIIPDQTSLFTTIKYLTLLYWNRFLFMINLSKTDSRFVHAKKSKEKLQEFAEWYAKNNFQNKVPITVFSFRKFLEAMDYLVTRRAIGKVIVKMEEENE
ncbi:hypothetical protein ABK040_005622 [Willaertia magna]